MNGRRAIVGLCMLCALLTSAIAAQSASAITGTTAATCKKGPGDTGVSTFNSAHCRSTDASGEWGHYQINEKTEAVETITLTFKMKFTLGGVATTLTATELEGTGTIENTVAGSGEHTWRLFFQRLFRNIEVSPFTKCIVYTDDGTATPGAQGVIDTEELTRTSEGQGMGVKVEPVNAEKVYARFWILDKNKKGAGGECAIPGTYTMTGSVIETPEGATISTTHEAVTGQNTLKIGIGGSSVKAGIEGGVTIEARKIGSGAPYTAISSTTYST